MYEHIRTLAASVGTRPPDRIVVMAETNAYVRESGLLLGLWRVERTLAIGAPLLDVLTVAHLNSVVAHELGHCPAGPRSLRGWGDWVPLETALHWQPSAPS